ncbi:RES family NAD+ phosphorylase [bacterium]|nr:RES family NAD+ phosphorylase [bacterium]
MNKKNQLDFTIFDKETIDKQFKQLEEELKPSMNYKDLLKKFHRILHNRVLPALVYDSKSPEFTLYRITTVYEGFNKNDPSCYSYNPKPQNDGRAHKAGYPVFYGALDPSTAISEMKGDLDDGKRFYISRWKIKFTSNTSVHSLLINSKTIYNNHILNPVTSLSHNKLKSMVNNIPQKFKEGYIYAIEKMGDLFTTKKDTLYHITSAYSHDILYDAKLKGLNISIIMYPSVENNLNSINWAIHPSFVNSDDMVLKDVFELSVDENNLDNKEANVNLSIHKKGKFHDGKFSSWEVPNYRLLKIEYECIKVQTYNGDLLEEVNICNMQINKTKKTIKDLIKHSIDINYIKKNLSKLSSDEEDDSPLDFEKKEFNGNLLLHFEHGNEILTENGKSCIKIIFLPIKWIKEYIDGN